MSSRLPAVRPGDAVRALEKAGWIVKRQRVSHVSMRKGGFPALVTIPQHRRDLPTDTLRDITTDARLTVEEFVELL